MIMINWCSMVATGLDSVSAAKVASVLHDIAHDLNSPTAIIASIHQPKCVIPNRHG